MTNPFQHGYGALAPDSSSSNPIPTLGQRRSSYASVLSGSASLSRPPMRVGAFSHLLNPVHDGDLHSSHLYGPPSRQRHDSRSGRNGVVGSDAAGGGSWQPRFSQLPWFSRAFDMYMSRDPLMGDEYSAPTNISSTGFLAPSYLKGSAYLQKLEEAHAVRVAAQRETAQHLSTLSQAQGGSAGGSGLPSSGSSLGLHSTKLPPGSHRGMTYELVEKPPAFEDDDAVTPLPSRWNKDDKHPGLEILSDGYEVKYTGHRSSSERDHEACAIRADHYMPPQGGVYYFEVLILNRKRDDTTIGVGFSSKQVSLSRAPGWEPESWGYHGDDGNCFAAQNVGKPYGPKFGPGDTIGCGVNFRNGQVFFTKNGDDQGIAFRDVNFSDVKGKLYPIVGLKKPGDHIWANFGQIAFQFDIDGYVKRQKEMIWDEISIADTSALVPGLNETELIQQLVLQFLQHDGYVETARAFAEEIHTEKTALNLDPNAEVEGINIRDDEDANNRQRIRRAILEGDVDKALKYTNAYYPQVLKDNEQVYFRLKCRKFIEMIRKEAELNLLLEKKRPDGNGKLNEDLDQEMEEAYEEDENGVWDDQMDTEDGIDEPPPKAGKLLEEALDFGRELRREFGQDPRKEVVKQLEEIFALIAYKNPLKEKEVAHLLSRDGRVAVAEELNSAILMSLGKSSRAALETLYAQTKVLLSDLAEDGGDGAFVTVDDVISEIPKPALL